MGDYVVRGMKDCIEQRELFYNVGQCGFVENF